MSKTISILGCGWLGAPLAQLLISDGYTVNGSVRQEEELENLKKLGINPYQITVEKDSMTCNNTDFFSCDVLIISIPPGRKDGNVLAFADKIKVIRTAIDKHNIPNVVFISSTSVYPENNATVKEEDAIEPEKPSGQVILEAENILRHDRTYNLTVIRLAGLIGSDRNPLKFYNKETRCRNANAPLNLIHIDDAVGVIQTIIHHNIWNNTFNACCEEHPSRHEFYALAAELTNGEPPVFDAKSKAGYKLVNSNKLVTLSGYQFKYRNPLDYVREIYANQHI